MAGSQLLPVDDLFTTNFYGYSPTRYIRVIPYPDATIGSVTAKWENGHYHDAYMTDVGHGGPAAAYIDGGGTARNSVGVIERTHYRQDAIATLQPAVMLLGGGSWSDSTFRMCGVMGRVRVSTPTVNANTRDEAFSTITDGYIFMYHHRITLDLWHYSLVRVNGGVATLLTSVDVGATSGTNSPNHNTHPDSVNAPTRMWMRVRGNAGTVFISCFRRRMGFGPNGFTDEEIITYDDTDANRIVTSGRWGFGVQAAGTDSSGTQCVGVATEFTIQDGQTIPNTLYCDLFARRQRKMGRKITDALGNVGYSVMPAWTGDSHGPDDGANTHYSQFLRDQHDVGNQASIGHSLPTGQSFGFYISTRRSDGVGSANWNNQHRSVNVICKSSPTIDREVGIALRYTSVNQGTYGIGGADADKRCYVAVLVYDGVSASFDLELRHYGGGGAHTVIATALSAVLPATVRFGFYIDFDFECQDTAPPNARPAMRVILDGVEIVMTSQVAGVDVFGTWVVDGRTSAITGVGSDGEGLYFTGTLASTPRAFFDDWLQMPLSNILIDDGGGGSEDDPDTFASVEMKTETSGQFGRLEVQLSWPVTEGHQWYQKRFSPRSGHKVVYADAGQERRSFRLQAAGITDADRDYLLDFMEDHNGGEIPFEWVLLRTEEVIPVRFARPKAVLALLQRGIDAFDIDLIEALGPPPPEVVFAAFDWSKPPRTSGVATAGSSGNLLVDVNATFNADGVANGLKVWNRTTGARGAVSSFTDTTITCVNGLQDGTRQDFQEGDIYDVGTEFYFAWHIRDDGFYAVDGLTTPTRVVPFKLSGPAPAGGVQVAFQVTGTAVAGVNYTLNTPSPINIEAGVSEGEISITVLDPGFWYVERSIILTLIGSATAQPQISLADEFHFWIYPHQTNEPPPAVEFQSSGATAAGVGLINIRCLQRSTITGSLKASLETTAVRLKVVSTTGGLVAGDHFELPIDGEIAIGDDDTLDASSTHGQIEVLRMDVPGTITIGLHLEPDDGSEENFWGKTEDARLEGVDYDTEERYIDTYPFPGEPATHAAGGGNTKEGAPPNATGIETWTQEELGVPIGDRRTHPDGGLDLYAVIQSQWIGNNVNDFYWRESFEAGENAGVPVRGHVTDNWAFYSVYIDSFVDTPNLWRNCEFVSLQIRNRVPGNLEMGAVFWRNSNGFNRKNVASSMYSGGVLVATKTTDTGVWGLWDRERLHPTARCGVEEETFLDGRKLTRLWVAQKFDGTQHIETNDNAGITGNATGGSGTTLVDTGKNFATLGVAAGDVIINTTDGCRGVVTSVVTSTITCSAGFTEGKDNNFVSGDGYRVYANKRGTATANDPTGTVLTDSAGGLTDIGLFDDVVNLRTGAIGNVSEVTSSTQLTFDPPLSGGAPDNEWKIGDNYMGYNKWAIPLRGWLCNAIFRYGYAQPGDGLNSQDSSSTIVGGSAGLRGTGALLWGWHYVMLSAIPTNPPRTYYADGTPRYWPKAGFWNEPRGNARKYLAGQTTWVLTIP